jgi:hypothetical protein
LSVPWRACSAPSGNPNWKKYLVLLAAAAGFGCCDQ